MTEDKYKIDLLDHGHVRLVSYMQPAPGTAPDNWDGDLEVSRNARVSYDAPARPQDKKLINYLYKNRHTSPFESMTFTFEVKAPIFVLRQWHRHRTWSYNEISARYAELPEEYYLTDAYKIGTQSKDNKQVRDIDTGFEDSEWIAQRMEENQEINQHMGRAFDLYRKLIDSKWPRELARSVLPVATYSHMFATVNLHNLLHFIRLRLHEHSQYEIRVYAQALLDLIQPIVPASVEAFKNSENN